MRYHDAGLDNHSNDTPFIDRWRYNANDLLASLPTVFNRAGYAAYFGDITDRMRDANGTVRNLWIMLRDRRNEIDSLKRQRSALWRSIRVAEVRADSWVAGCKRMVAQRDEAIAEKVDVQEANASLQHAWKGMNEIIDRRNVTIRDQLASLEQQRTSTDFWHDEFLKEAEANDKHADVLKLAVGKADRASERACDYARRIDNLRMDAELDARAIQNLRAKALKQAKQIRATSTFTDECNTRQAARIKQLEADLVLVKAAAYRESQEVDKLRARQQQAVSALVDPARDAWAATVSALAALEGRK